MKAMSKAAAILLSTKLNLEDEIELLSSTFSSTIDKVTKLTQEVDSYKNFCEVLERGIDLFNTDSDLNDLFGWMLTAHLNKLTESEFKLLEAKEELKTVELKFFELKEKREVISAAYDRVD